jgi:hypothetical protein
VRACPSSRAGELVETEVPETRRDKISEIVLGLFWLSEQFNRAHGIHL